jgi:hypothetical protein
MTKSKKFAELERCTHSLRDSSIDPMGDEPVFYNRPCVLVFHTEEDKKGRPVHQDDRGRTWS